MDQCDLKWFLNVAILWLRDKPERERRTGINWIEERMGESEESKMKCRLSVIAEPQFPFILPHAAPNFNAMWETANRSHGEKTHERFEFSAGCFRPISSNLLWDGGRLHVWLYLRGVTSDHIPCPRARVKVRLISWTGNRDDEWAVFSLLHIDTVHTHTLRPATVKKIKRTSLKCMQEPERELDLAERKNPVYVCFVLIYSCVFYTKSRKNEYISILDGLLSCNLWISCVWMVIFLNSPVS